MGTIARILGAWLLFGALFCAFVLLVIGIPLFGIYQWSQSGHIAWAIAGIALGVVSYSVYSGIARRFGKREPFSESSGPII